MSYVTNSDIEARVGSAAYVQLTDDDGDGSANVAVVDEARLAAEGEVNSLLAARFVVPIDIVAFPELADLLKSITLDLVEYRLRIRRPPAPKESLDQYLRALIWLGDVSEGRVSLPSISVLPTAANRGLIAQSIGEARVLTREELSSH